ncbi:MAG: LamG domain-containing protein [Planctomycetes bacterium]|nr:LamG domain-containing protein [Planctomycetota bacterium]MCB9884789.1 LamG domain-containing protein [Planctomycetota bacterium]
MHRILWIAIAATLVRVTPAQSPPLLANWRMDETAGVVASDSSANGNSGTLVNFGAAPWVPGHAGNALSFDGVDDYVAVTLAAGLPVYAGRGAPFSVAFWVKAPAQSDRRVYSEQQAAPTGNGPLFSLGSGSTAAGTTDKLRVFLRNDNPSEVGILHSNAVVFDDQWHHVVYSEHAGRAAIFVDGAPDATFDYSRWNWGPLSPLQGTFTMTSVTLGAVVRNSNIAAPLLGLVDDVRVYGSRLDVVDANLLFMGIDPPVIAASLAGFGYGCGQGPLDLAVTGSAQHGGTIFVQMFRGEPNALALVGIGLGPIAPVDLGAFGFAGCTLYQQNIATSVIGVMGPAGSSGPFAFGVPAATGFAGTSLSLQGITFGAGLELSPAALAMIGR